jgi:hypothetical protein
MIVRTQEIKCSEQTARNSTTFSCRQIPIKIHKPKKEYRTSGKKYTGKRHNIMKKPTGLNSNAHKIQVWTAQNGTKNNNKLEASWKRPNGKLVAYATYRNTQIFSNTF